MTMLTWDNRPSAPVQGGALRNPFPLEPQDAAAESKSFRISLRRSSKREVTRAQALLETGASFAFETAVQQPSVERPLEARAAQQRQWAEGVVLVAERGMAQCAITSLDQEYRVALPVNLFPAEPTTGVTFRISMATDSAGFRTPQVEVRHVPVPPAAQEVHSRIDAMLAEFRQNRA